MLVRNITYEVEDNQDNKEILKDVSLTIDEHFVAITGPNGGESIAGDHCRNHQDDIRSDHFRWRGYYRT